MLNLGLLLSVGRILPFNKRFDEPEENFQSKRSYFEPVVELLFPDKFEP